MALTNTPPTHPSFTLTRQITEEPELTYANDVMNDSPMNNVHATFLFFAFFSFFFDRKLSHFRERRRRRPKNTISCKESAEIFAIIDGKEEAEEEEEEENRFGDDMKGRTDPLPPPPN